MVYNALRPNPAWFYERLYMLVFIKPRMNYYIVHRDNVGKPPVQIQRAVLATWVQEHDTDLPTQASLDEWIEQTRSTFPADLVDETGKVLFKDARYE